MFKVEIRKTCKICGQAITSLRSRTYCSAKCRTKANNKKGYIKRGGAEYQRNYLAKRLENSGKALIQCQICGKRYRQVGSHVFLTHKMNARDYREKYGFDVKRGQLPEDLRELKAEHVFENGTVDNLKQGKKFWFKPGQEGVGVYKRSEQTMERLRLNKVRIS